jgi:amino acid transporter
VLAIMASIIICTLVYLIVVFAVRASLPIEDIIAAKDFALASAAEPTLGVRGFQLTAALALVATASGLLASMFAVSRMLTMLTEMRMVPHSQFGMPGPVRNHMLVYTAVLAALMTVLFDLGRIASLGVFFYLVMAVAIQFGVLMRLRRQIGARAWVLVTAITLDVAVLGVFGVMKLWSDPWVVIIAVAAIAAVFVLERSYPSALRVGPPAERPPWP